MHDRIHHRMGGGGSNSAESQKPGGSSEEKTTPAKPHRRISAFAFDPSTAQSERGGGLPKNKDLEWGVNDKPRIPQWPAPSVQTYRPEDEGVSFYGEPRKPDAEGFTNLAPSGIPGPIEIRGGMHEEGSTDPSFPEQEDDRS